MMTSRQVNVCESQAVGERNLLLRSGFPSQMASDAQISGFLLCYPEQIDAVLLKLTEAHMT